MILDDVSARQQRQASQRSRLQLNGERNGLWPTTVPVAIQRRLSAAARTESLERQLQRMRSRLHQGPSSGSALREPRPLEDAPNTNPDTEDMAGIDLTVSPEALAQAAAEAADEVVDRARADLETPYYDAEAEAEFGRASRARQSGSAARSNAVSDFMGQLQSLDSNDVISNVIIAQAPASLRAQGTDAGSSESFRAQLRAQLLPHLRPHARPAAAADGASLSAADREALYNEDDPEDHGYIGFEQTPFSPGHTHGRCSRSIPTADLDMIDPRKALHPQECPLLRPGCQFEGSQSVSRAGTRADDWSVTLTVDQCDWGSGYLCGTMTARNVPQSSVPVATFFEAEIVGAGPHTFASKSLGTDRQGDLAHWYKFAAFRTLQQGQARGQDESARGQDESAVPREQRESVTPWDEPAADDVFESLRDFTDSIAALRDYSRNDSGGSSRDEGLELSMRLRDMPTWPQEISSAGRSSTRPQPHASRSRGRLFGQAGNEAIQSVDNVDSGGGSRAAAEQPSGSQAEARRKQSLDDVVFLRIKEKAFLGVDPERSGLTIAGLYYCCVTMDNHGGASLEGFYHDTRGQPFQRLSLSSTQATKRGFISSSYEFR